MLKKIKNIVIIVTILLSIIIIIGIVFILEDAGLIELGGDNSANSSISGVPTDADVQEVIAMSDEEVWKGLTGGLLTDRPAEKTPSNANEIESAVREKIVKITVPTRAWEDASNSSNMKIVKKDVTLEVNILLAELFTEFFNDLYNDVPNFVITQLGGFRIDGTENGQIGFRSAHTYGAAVDINWSDNPYGEQQPYSKSEWEKMDEGHTKYQIIYKDSEVVKIAHKYTLYWGGEWSQSTKDIMHFSFICDGKSRVERLKMFGN